METINVLARNIIFDLQKHKVLVDQNVLDEGGFFVGDEWVCLEEGVAA